MNGHGEAGGGVVEGNFYVSEMTVLPIGASPTELDVDAFAIKVAWRNAGQFAVLRHGRCLAADGSWDYEPQPSSRTDEWIAAHRFGQGEALRRAVEAVDDLTVNGRTWAGWKAHHASLRARS